MEGEAAAAAVQVLVQNLIDLCREEISLIRGFEEDANELKVTLDTIRSFFADAERKFIDEDSVKEWLKNLEDIAFDADNVLDELNYHRLSEKIKKTGKKKKVLSCPPCFNLCTRRRGIALTIKNINRRFESASLRASALGLQRRLADAPPALPVGTEETDPFTVDPIFVGRDEGVSRIVEMLLNACPTDEHVFSIVPIQGMGGLGKTTLARKVFNHEKIQTQFGKHIWVHVSTNFDPIMVLKKILTDLTSESVQIENRGPILKKLQEALATKTYLLVLDDVWNEDPHKWESFVNSLSGITSAKGNVILVTTRNREVASLVEKPPLSIYGLIGLPAEDCWSIIKAKSFGAGNIPSEEFETIGRQIAERCGGLPLAANVVGGVLRGKSKDEWVSIQRDGLSDIGGGDVISKILKLSYDNLSSPSIKKCFAYCSVFPKGDWISRGELIELWMAEGFLGTSDMETEGHKFVNLLLQSSLLQAVGTDYYGNVESCSMHDLVHDVAGLALDSSSKARYMRWECKGGESSPVPEEQAKCLRTLFYSGKISDITFSKFRSLHSLTLEDDDASELPDSIRELSHLRFLNISRTRIESLPDFIGKLYHLQTLRAKDARQLPSTLKDLINLRHLHVYDMVESPPELGRLTSLQTLQHFKVQDKEGHRIEELGSLNNLKGRLKIDGLEKVNTEEEAKKANLFQKKNIVRLELTYRRSETNHENVLEGLRPHKKLKELAIWGFGGAKFPSWTLNMAGFDNLMSISLGDCSKCEELPVLGHLPRLKSLYVGYLGNVRSIGSSFYNIGNCGFNDGVRTTFRALESLTLEDMPNLTEWVEVELPSAVQVEVFPCLKELKIRRCPQLISVPHQFPPYLEGLLMVDCANLKSIPYFCSSQGLTSLHSLTIRNCERLMNLSPEMMKSCAASLETLTIVNVPHLIHILGESGKFCNLERLEMGPCASDSWDCASFNKIVDEILQSSQDTLSEVILKGVEDWDSLPDSLQHLTALRWLHLYNFGIEELPEWLGNLTSLLLLSLIDCSKLRHPPSVEAMRCLTELSYLRIYNCPILKQRCIQQQTNGDAASEWPGISHIPDVYVNGDKFRYGKKVTEAPSETSDYIV